MVGKGALPTSMERGAVSQPFLYNYLSPNMITNEDRELQEDEMNHVLIGTIEERKKMVAPFAQGTSSENNVGDRVRTFRWLRLLSVGSSIFRYGDRSRDIDRDPVSRSLNTRDP